MKKTNAFRRSVTKNEPDRGFTWDLYAENDHGWCLKATHVDDYFGKTLDFIEVDHPDGTSSYFTLDNEAHELRAGPFGGGYSWAVPKYVQDAALTMAVEAWAARTEPVDA